MTTSITHNATLGREIKDSTESLAQAVEIGGDLQVYAYTYLFVKLLLLHSTCSGEAAQVNKCIRFITSLTAKDQ